MSIIHNPETGWTFTHGSQTYGPYSTKEEAAERLYDLERGIQPAWHVDDQAETNHALLAWVDEHFPALQTEQLGERDDARLIIGSIAGCDVTAAYSIEDDHDLYSAWLTWNGMEVETNGRSYVNLNTGEGCDNVGDISLSEWPRVKALAATNTVEQLIALAQSVLTLPAAVAAAQRSGDFDTDDILDCIDRDASRMDAEARMEAFLEAEERVRDSGTVIDPGGPGRVRVQRAVCDDSVDKKQFGKEIGTDYTCGETLFFVPDNMKHGLYVRAFGDEIDLNVFYRDLPDLLRLLNDPRVKAEQARFARKPTR